MVAQANPKDSMVSTWRTDQSLWGPDHHFLNLVQGDYAERQKQVPVFKKSEPVPILTLWSCDLYVMVFAAWPMLVQWLCIGMTGSNTSPLLTFFLYALAFQFNAIHEVKVVERLGYR